MATSPSITSVRADSFPNREHPPDSGRIAGGPQEGG
jgi:hypothetical protein